jgi:predicted nucleic acid-binding protein
MILLDTSVLIAAPQSIGEWGQAFAGETPLFSALSYAELAFGIAVAPDRDTRAERQRTLAWLDSLAVDWLPFNRQAADGYAAVAPAVHAQRRAHSRRTDIMLAGHAYALGASLVTLNPKDFELVSNLVKIVSPQPHA